MLEKFRKKVNDRLKEFMDSERDLTKALAEYTLRGGKRIRAAILYYTYKTYSDDARYDGGAFDIACAMELFQSGLLIHDDWMDNDSMRRGKETLHVYFSRRYGKHRGESLAILAGDLALTLGFLMISNADIDDRKKNDVINVMSEIISNVTYGQSLDIKQDIKSIKDIEEINYYKTATYSFIGPLKIGLALAGKDDKKLIKAGKYAGIAFQLQDDLIDIMSDASGKDIGSDIKDGKINYVTYHLLKKADKEDNEYIRSIIGSDFDVQKVRQLIIKYKIDRLIKEKIDYNITKAKKNIKSNRFLLELLDYFNDRMI